MRWLRSLAVLVLMAPVGFTSQIWVPDDYLTIQEAIDAAVDGDEVVVRPGVYIENIDFLGKAITVRSQQGPPVTSIDGGQPVHPDYGSVVLFENGEGPNSRLEGFTLTSGTGTTYPGLVGRDGGGICCRYGSSPTIVGNVIRLNHADYGGGIMVENSSAPEILGNTVSDNTARFGAGIDLWDSSSPVIRDNTISSNVASEQVGGLLGTEYCSPLVENNVIKDNVAHIYIGGVGFHDNCDPTITGNVIVGNEAETNAAAGVFIGYYSTGTISDNVIAYNSDHSVSFYGGGGIMIDRYCDTLVSNNVVFENSANAGGGIGVYNQSNATLINNTLYSNHASDRGGGLCCNYSSTVTILNSIFWDNQAITKGPEIMVMGTSTVTISYSDVDGGQTSCQVQPGSTLIWGSGMIDFDPMFIDPVYGDFCLQQDPCQPGVVNDCVDGGDPGSSMIPGTTRTDRVADGGVVDMGYHCDIASIPGIPFCDGDPLSGTPCPCNNDNDGTVPGSGCANGVAAPGARLAGRGTASVSEDTLVLTAVRQEPDNSGLFFQAENDLSPGTTWGDGLRCAGGGLMRLEVVFADEDGTSSTTTGISANAGNVQPGDTKYYQCWYRNPLNSPCGHQFNATNGYAVTWQP